MRTSIIIVAVTIFAMIAGCRRESQEKTPAWQGHAPSSSGDRPMQTSPPEVTSQRASSTDHAAGLTENEKIEALIAALAGLKDATFIRNGSAHNVDEAVEHMRMKWSWKKDEITTADDFIRIAATGSSLSGKPYTIRFADGHEELSADWFRARLKEISKDGT